MSPLVAGKGSDNAVRCFNSPGAQERVYDALSDCRVTVFVGLDGENAVAGLSKCAPQDPKKPLKVSPPSV